MRLRQLRFLVAVYEEGSFTSAATRLHATQSGISAQIKLLESSLETKLFERSVSGVEPTPAGRLAYQRATQILSDTEALKADMSALKDGITGTVSAGLMPTTTRSVLAPVLEKFAVNYPNVDIRIEEAYSAQLCSGVSCGRLDFALVPPSSTLNGLRSSFLATDVEVYVTAANKKRKHLSTVDLTELEPFKLILPGPENARTHKIQESIKTFNLPVKQVMKLDTMMATLDLVARSDWTSILPGCLVIDDIKSIGRNLHPIIKPALSLDYVLVEQASKTLGPAAKLLSEELRTELTRVCDQSRLALTVER